MAATPRVTNNSMDQIPLQDKVQLEIGSIDQSREEVHLGLLEHARNNSRAWELRGKSTDHRALKAQLRKRLKAVYQKLMEKIEKKDPGYAAELDDRNIDEIL